MALADYVNTFGQMMLHRYGERVHKLAIHAGFTCPNRDGSKGRGGCTFCNNASFNPAGRRPASIAAQLAAGRRVIGRFSKARRFLAYFQAYTNTYAAPGVLAALYAQALAEPDVIGLSIGTRPDCVPEAVLDLLADYRSAGLEIWLELGLQSAFDETLARVRRGHDLAEYRRAVHAARTRGIPVCTHLIAGLPGETAAHCRSTLDIVLELGVDGLKLHPLHVVRGTQLANDWRRGNYHPLALDEYVAIAANLIQRTPARVVFHRLTGTAPAALLLAPAWCADKWRVLNGIERELQRCGGHQGQLAPPVLAKEEAHHAI